MINNASIATIKTSTFSKGFRKPVYDSYSFNKIPASIATLLGSSKLGSPLPKDCFKAPSCCYKNVILLFVDGFGYHLFERFLSQIPALKRFCQDGVVSCLSSLFPSTTAAHVTFMHTHLLPAESGIYEWYYYEPLFDAIIAPLPFRYAKDHRVETLQKELSHPEELFPFPTIYATLQEEGIDSYLFNHEDIVDSTYSRCMSKNAKSIGYASTQEGLSACVDLIGSTQGKKYIYFYISDIDAVGHREGIDSAAYEKAVHATFASIEEQLLIPLQKRQENVAICMIADHGMTLVDPKNTHYLNLMLPNLQEVIKKNSKGELIVPAGSCRDFFLHIQESALSQTHHLLSQKLQGIAEVYLTQTLIDEGLFGNKISSRFKERVGNLCILPYEKEAVFWYEKNRFEQHFYSAHGGLTPDEMDTVFAFLAL